MKNHIGTPGTFPQSTQTRNPQNFFNLLEAAPNLSLGEDLLHCVFIQAGFCGRQVIVHTVPVRPDLSKVQLFHWYIAFCSFAVLNVMTGAAWQQHVCSELCYMITLILTL